MRVVYNEMLKIAPLSRWDATQQAAVRPLAWRYASFKLSLTLMHCGFGNLFRQGNPIAQDKFFTLS